MVVLPTPLPLSHVPSQPLFQNPESSRRSQGALSPRPAPRWLMRTPSPSGSSQQIPHIPVSGPETPLWRLLALGTRGGSSSSPSRPPSLAPLFSKGLFSFCVNARAGGALPERAFVPLQGLATTKRARFAPLIMDNGKSVRIYTVKAASTPSLTVPPGLCPGKADAPGCSGWD